MAGTQASFATARPGLAVGLVEITGRDVGLRRAQSSRLAESGLKPISANLSFGPFGTPEFSH